MKADTEKKIFVCPYCDSVETFDNISSQSLKEELKGIVSEAIRDANQGSGASGAAAGAGSADHRSKGQKVKDTLIMILQIFFCVILSIASVTIFTDEFQVVGFISLLQLILMITALVNKGKYHRTGKLKAKKVAKLCVIAASILIFVWFAVLMAENSSSGGSGIGTGSSREAVWPAQGMGSNLPVLPGTLKRAYSNKDGFDATSGKITADDYANYVEACKKAGFDVDIEAGDMEFIAYDQEDNKLQIDYWKYSDELHVKLSEGIRMSEFQWSSQGVAGEVPQPTAEKSYTEYFSKDSYRIYVGDVTREEFIKYATECIAAGFEGSVSGDSYYGTKKLEEKHSIRISIDFQRGRIMYISVYESNY